MPRPTTKDQLISESQKEYAALEQFLATLTAEQMIQPGVLGEWSVKDTIAHLLEWQQMFLGWYAAGLRGENPPTPAVGYKWSQLPALNQVIYEKYRLQTLDDILARFRDTHWRVTELLQSLSQEELFASGRYLWARKNALASYLTSITSSHYRWARTELRKHS
jgi:hypothetical protein